ncbi:hypothetical protein R3P38DRAFT_3267583 [Favolaschia claudopus]|uniref:Uncharacterized protein n=1 Tax=Favolaschia claudopus TaxID=2862362 RepID=A0AAW0BQX8_9AGAR
MPPHDPSPLSLFCSSADEIAFMASEYRGRRRRKCWGVILPLAPPLAIKISRRLFPERAIRPRHTLVSVRPAYNYLRLHSNTIRRTSALHLCYLAMGCESRYQHVEAAVYFNDFTVVSSSCETNPWAFFHSTLTRHFSLNIDISTSSPSSSSSTSAIAAPWTPSSPPHFSPLRSTPSPSTTASPTLPSNAYSAAIDHESASMSLAWSGRRWYRRRRINRRNGGGMGWEETEGGGKRRLSVESGSAGFANTQDLSYRRIAFGGGGGGDAGGEEDVGRGGEARGEEEEEDEGGEEDVS